MSAVRPPGPAIGSMGPPPIPIKRTHSKLANALPLEISMKRRRMNSYSQSGRSDKFPSFSPTIQQSPGWGDYPPPMTVFRANTRARQQPREFFKPGQICWIQHHETYNGGSSRPGTPASSRGSMMSLDQKTQSHISHSNEGVPIYTKGRPFIIIATFSDHYHALPMYTHGNSGLSKVANKNEHVYIRDHRRTYLAVDNHQDSPHLELMTENIPREEKLYPDSSTVHFTQLFSKRYDTCVHPAGRLTKSSTKELANLFIGHEMKAITASIAWCQGRE